MSARELRAEARAWRRAAEWCAIARSYDGWMVLAIDGEPAERRRQMHARLGKHWEDSAGSGSPNDFDPSDRVLACLFLALECEDEAKEAAGG